MKTSIESNENSQVMIRVEVDQAEMEVALEHAYRHVVKQVAIPGFRKGRTPRAVLEQYVGREALQKEALEELVPELCARIVTEQKLDAIEQPQVEILQYDPVVFRVIFSLRPNVELGDYRAIRIERPAVEIGEAEVDEFIAKLRDRHGEWSPVARPANFDDLVVVDVVQIEKEGTTKSHQGQQVLLTKGSLLPLPGFSEHLVGMSAGEEKEFILSYADDYKIRELAGKEFKFNVKITEVKEKHLPELDDEFAKSLGEGMDTMAALRNYAASGLKKAADDAAARDYEKKVLEAVVGSAKKIEYPPILVEKEIDNMLRERDRAFGERDGLKNYMKAVNKTAQQLRDEMRPRAEEWVKQRLVLAKVSDEEKIVVDATELDAEIESMMKSAGEENDRLRELFGTPLARRVVEERMIRQKAMQRLVAIAMGISDSEQEPKAEAGKESKDGDAA